MEEEKSIIEVSYSTLHGVLKSSVWPSIFGISISIFLGFFNIVFGIFAISMFSLFYLLIVVILLKVASFSSKVIITEDSILVLIHNTKFMELKWNEISKIIVFTENYQIPSVRFRLRTSNKGISLSFEGKNSSRMLHLWCLAFNFKQQVRILDVIRNRRIGYGIDILEDNSSRSRIPLKERPCSDYREFYHQNN